MTDRSDQPRARGEAFRTIWQKPDDPRIVQIIDQRRLPHEYVIHDLKTWEDGANAISEMLVRGAPLIGATAAWSLYLAAVSPGGGDRISLLMQAAEKLGSTRPTAVNLQWAIDRVMAVVAAGGSQDIVGLLQREATAICDEDIEISKGIGRHGLALIEEISRQKSGGTVNILTHCNAGSLATINWGTATAPMYFAHQKGINIHVWVDETRPRNQGSQLTAWELAENGVPHTVIVDNVGGHLMQHGMVDLCITGTDRTTRSGDVANKIGTYLKALAAHDNGVPFYVALPSTTIDWTIDDGIRDIPIEERDATEVSHVYGRTASGMATVQTVAAGSPVMNYAFDVTPSRLVTGLITECGVCEASEAGLAGLFPQRAQRT
ncbi:MAG: S-methyl-5-thioribose-1-phosphate isomerase [Gammaproteobacteria bacterium]|nr:S-methyl-5-thioribose-1-phosphate isomerase [Gammaproteobacteria bacterium]MDH4315286.1 S-methyl-5-thioribose-1-phosphate isomerase [Gammaproteobacteria bacterium]MDH5213948.1 S-methyl-5-thioribose-1-phosphate isomerase [Gammaproteobacteria bacterium]MDH5499586.1 S-methyl-5-thioribose-1-phosphate isomerase [Gammaproteobacteria bacterium]